MEKNNSSVVSESILAESRSSLCPSSTTEIEGNHSKEKAANVPVKNRIETKKTTETIEENISKQLKAIQIEKHGEFNLLKSMEITKATPNQATISSVSNK